MEIELFDSPVFKKIKKEYVAYFRKLYDAAEVVWKYTENKHESFRKSTKFKEAIEVAKNNGIDLQLFHQDNIADLGYSDLRQKVFQKLRLAGNKEAEQKLRVLYYERDFLPLEHFTGIFDTLYLTQHWEFTEKPSNNEFFPVWLQTANHVYDYKPKIKSGEDMEWTEEGDWLEENFFTNPRGMIRAVVYTEDREYEYNFQDIPAAKKLLNIILETSIKWGEAARATDFDFDVVSDGVQWNEDCFKVAWNAAPEDLRNEHITAVRQLVKEVWKYHLKKIGSQEETEQSVSIRTSLPQELVLPTDKVSQKVFSGELESNETFSIMTGGRGKKELSALLSIDFDDLGKDVLLEPFDRAVHDAVLSLYVAGNEYMTPQMIFKVQSGNKDGKITEKNFLEISKSVQKCIDTKIELDASKEAEAYGFDKAKATYHGQLLMADRMVVELNGETVEAIHVYRTPILYEYADMKNQVARIDLKLLDTPINKTNEVLILQDYLLRRISVMKNPKNKQ